MTEIRLPVFAVGIIPSPPPTVQYQPPSIMPPRRKMRTTIDGPVVVTEKTLAALIAIRREKLLPTLYGRVSVARSVIDTQADSWRNMDHRNWLDIEADRPEQSLPPRVANVNPSDAASLRLALAIGASLILLEEPAKEKAKLSFFKCEGTVSILVLAHRLGHLSAVRPMVKALDRLGHSHVLPPPDQLDALWKALDNLE